MKGRVKEKSSHMFLQTTKDKHVGLGLGAGDHRNRVPSIGLAGAKTTQTTPNMLSRPGRGTHTHARTRAQTCAHATTQAISIF